MKCPKCDAKYSVTVNLVDHLKLSHGVKQAEIVSLVKRAQNRTLDKIAVDMTGIEATSQPQIQIVPLVREFSCPHCRLTGSAENIKNHLRSVLRERLHEVKSEQLVDQTQLKKITARFALV